VNLIGNAVKFTAEGGIDILVRTERLTPGERMTVSFFIRDTGIGISPQQKEKLFQAFSQGDASTSRRYGGTGLGLALSRQIAVALGGDVVLHESRPGQGSTFEFKVPNGKWREGVELLNLERPAHRNEERGAEDPDLRGVRVLLAEDTEEIRLVVIRFLEKAGASVDVAVNGVEAIKRASEADYDVVLMDLQMPVMDGYDATERLRTWGYRRPIIALTAHAMREERERCLRSGFDDHLTKPVERQSLLREVIEHARRPHEEWAHH